MTQIEFPEHFDAESHICYGIDENAVDRVIRQPDAKELLHFRTAGPPTAVFFKATEGEGVVGLLVIAQRRGAGLRVIDALPVPREVDVEKKTPLGILALLCDRYGLRMRTGQHEGTLIKGVIAATGFGSDESKTEIEILTDVPRVRAPGSVRVLMGNRPDGRSAIRLLYAINPDRLLEAMGSG